jgi:hypothetical protein
MSEDWSAPIHGWPSAIPPSAMLERVKARAAKRRRRQVSMFMTSALCVTAVAAVLYVFAVPAAFNLRIISGKTNPFGGRPGSEEPGPGTGRNGDHNGGGLIGSGSTGPGEKLPPTLLPAVTLCRALEWGPS